MGTADPPPEFVAAQAAKAAAAVAEAAAADADDIGAEGFKTVKGEGKLEHVLKADGEAAALKWVTVPVGEVASFLAEVADGAVAPVKVLAKKAAPTATPTPLAPAKAAGGGGSGHAEEL